MGSRLLSNWPRNGKPSFFLTKQTFIWSRESPRTSPTTGLFQVRAAPSWEKPFELTPCPTIVFLRILEYYQGILFLTTNRINSFDRAFMSRIHLALHYPPLTHHSRRELWYLFLKRASPDSAKALRQTGALDKFAAEILNGRQIKNLVRTASALALSSGSSADGRISQEYIESALQPMKQFENYMAGVFQREQEWERNHREESVVVEEEQHEPDDDEHEVYGSDEEEDQEEEDLDTPPNKRRRLEF